MNRSRSTPSRRSGWTIVELLVVLGILALLFALIVPAIQWSRSAARNANCQSNLRQIGLALQMYHESHRCFPAGSMNGFSPHVAILPFIEQNALYEQVDFSESFWLSHSERFEAVLTAGVALYRCPSQPSSAARHTGYIASNGTGRLFGGENGLFIRSAAMEQGPIRASRVADGLSNTAAFSETINDYESGNVRGKALVTAQEYGEGEGDAFISECLAIEPDGMAMPSMLGYPWMGGGVGNTLYVHTLGPNTRNCSNGSRIPTGIWSASSDHTGGLNILFADGAVKFVGDSIDLQIWRAVATRAGGEISVSF